jgi:hypothetical protein
MIAVAVAGTLTSVVVGLIRRHSAFQQRAAEYARVSDQEFRSGHFIEHRHSLGPAESEEPIVAAHYQRSDYYLALHRKYLSAARRPWLPVPPDPPPPK